MLVKTEGKRRKGSQRMRWLDDTQANDRARAGDTETETSPYVQEAPALLEETESKRAFNA